MSADSTQNDEEPDYYTWQTWAPVGHTPVVPRTGARFSLQMLSAINAQGEMRFMVHGS